MPTLGERSSARPRAKGKQEAKTASPAQSGRILSPASRSLEEPREQGMAMREQGMAMREVEKVLAPTATPLPQFFSNDLRKSAFLVKVRGRYNLKGREEEGGLEFNLVLVHREGANRNNYLKCH